MENPWPGEEELNERLLAIEAVAHSHHNVWVLEPVLLDLVRFFESDRVPRPVAVSALLKFIGAEPPRVGAVETLEFVSRWFRWPDLREGLEAARDSEDAFYVNRDLARSALAAFSDDWHGGGFRSFRRELHSEDTGR